MAPPALKGMRRIGLWQPLTLRDFQLLWCGESVSLLGDQFHFVALSWLTLELTGSGLALGTVLTVAAVPRAVFMLVAGALVDVHTTVMFTVAGLFIILAGVYAAARPAVRAVN